MTPPRLIDDGGRPFPLGAILSDGVGGEGTVYSIPNDPARVAKVYHDGKLPLAAEQIERLRFQITVRQPWILANTGWPTALLSDSGTRRPVGFTMPKVEGMAIWKLFQPQERLKCFPKATWAFQTRAALNMAAAFDELHTLGYIVGDVSLKNVFVSDRATVKLIDCDSYQVRTPKQLVPCRVGTPEYVPPELQRQSLGLRTENHDRFGLAVLIYQLLFLSAHPYCGIDHGPGDPTLEDNIRDYRFSQGPAAHTWQMAPPPITPTFADIPAELGNMFRRAFERGSQNGSRPTALEWNRALKLLETETATCTDDTGHKYWKGAAGGCTWCRLARHGGPEYYYGAAESGGPFVVDEARLREVLRRLQAIEFQSYSLDFNGFVPVDETSGLPLPEQVIRLKHTLESSQGIVEEEPPLPELAEEPYPLLEPLIDEQSILAEAESQPEGELDRRIISITLTFGVFLGIGLMPFGLYRPVISLIGFFVVIIFGASAAFWISYQRHMKSKRIAQVRQQMKQLLQEAQVENESIRSRNTWRLKEWRTRKDKIRETNDEIRRGWEAKNETIRNNNRNTRAKRKQEYIQALNANRKLRLELLRFAEVKIKALEREWFENPNNRRYHTLRSVLANSSALCSKLGQQFQSEILVLRTNFKDTLLHHHLQMHSITRTIANSLGSHRCQILFDNGIYTAADVSESTLRNIRGIGNKTIKILMDWKSQIFAQLQFDEKSIEKSREYLQIEQRYSKQQRTLLAECDRAIDELNSLAPACRTALQQMEGPLKAAFQQLAQARADLEIVDRALREAN